MPISFWSVFAAWLLIYLTKIPVAVAMHRAGGYDNRDPRRQQANLEGFGARAVAAHHNGFEAFAPFAAAVLVAHLLGARSGVMDALALTFLVARLVYVGCYLGDLATLRSVVWGVGWLATLAMFVAPLF